MPYQIYHRDGKITTDEQATKPYIGIKWPGMLVRGESVSMIQANEIIFRTMGTYFSSNSSDFVDYFSRLIGNKEHDGFLEEDNARKVGVLSLEYLNNSRIMSSWIGGPNGWIDWDGKVFSNNKNLGKYPTVEEVADEWATIARTFPFLDLRCQLIDHEAGYPHENGAPTQVLVEFVVKDGNVAVFVPEDRTPMMETVQCGFRNFMNNASEHVSKDFVKLKWNMFQKLSMRHEIAD